MCVRRWPRVAIVIMAGARKGVGCIKSKKVVEEWVEQTQDFDPGGCCSWSVWNQKSSLTCINVHCVLELQYVCKSNVLIFLFWNQTNYFWRRNVSKLSLFHSVNHVTTKVRSPWELSCHFGSRWPIQSVRHEHVFLLLTCNLVSCSSSFIHNNAHVQ